MCLLTAPNEQDIETFIRHFLSYKSISAHFSEKTIGVATGVQQGRATPNLNLFGEGSEFKGDQFVPVCTLNITLVKDDD